MLRNYFLINLILVIIIVFLGFRLYSAVTHPLDIPSAPAEKQEIKKDVRAKAEEKIMNEKPFRIISEMDIFRPSRSAPASEVKNRPVISVSKNTPRLFGTVILDNDKTAILENPDTRKTKTYRINESVAGFIIADILEDKVVLLRNGEKVEVRLREDKGIRPVRRRPAYNRPARQRRIQSRNPVSKPRLPAGELRRRRSMNESETDGAYVAH